MTTRRGLFALAAGAVALPLVGAAAPSVVRWYASWENGFGWVLSYRLADEAVQTFVCVGPDHGAMIRAAAAINDHYARAA